MKITEKLVNTIVIIIVIISIIIGIRSFKPIDLTSQFADLKSQITSTLLEISSVINSSLVVDDTQTFAPSPSPTPTPYVYHTPTAEQKKYILALGAILSKYNNETISTIKSNLEMPGIRPMMKDSWNTYDHISALATLDWLKTGGQSAEYDSAYQVLVLGNIISCKELSGTSPSTCEDSEIKSMYDIAKLVHEKVGSKSLLAWDYGHIINVSRFSYTLGYITEEEAWTYMVPAAMTIQKTYGSWEEFGTHYILGRAYWMRDMNTNIAQESILKYLLNPVNKTPWTTIDWKTDLK